MQRLAFVLVSVLSVISVAQSTRPIGEPVAALERFLELAKEGDAEKVRPLVMPLVDSDRDGPDEMANELHAVKRGFFKDASFRLLPGRRIEDVAIVPIVFRVPGRRPGVDPTFLVRVGDKWLLIFPDPGFKRSKKLTPEQKQRIEELMEWYAAPEQRRVFEAAKKPTEAEQRTMRLQSALALAVLSGKPDAVRQALADGADLNLPSSTGETALTLAAMKEDPTMLTFLLDAGARIDLAVPSKSPLREAIRLDRSANALLLIQRGARVDVSEREGETPLYRAAEKGMAEVVEAILKTGHKPDDAALPLPMLHVATMSGDFATFEVVRAIYPDLSIRNRYGGNALNMAGTRLSFTGRKEHDKITLALLDAGVDPHLKMRAPWVEPDRQTPLAGACTVNASVAMALLSRVEYSKEDLTRCLYDATKYQSVELLQKLIEKGADVKSTVRDGADETLLHIAVAYRLSPEHARVLLAAGHPVNTPIAFKNRTPLHQAVASADAEMVRLLLKDREAKDADGLAVAQLAAVRVEKGREIRQEDKIVYSPEFEDTPDEGRRIAALLGGVR